MAPQPLRVRGGVHRRLPLLRLPLLQLLLLLLLVAVAALAAAAPPAAAATPGASFRYEPLLSSLATPATAAVANQTMLYIPMRDGMPLWTVVSVPVAAAIGPVPTVLQRTPYTTDNWAGLAGVWNARGFAYVLQDQRGSGSSRVDADGAPVLWTYWRADGNDTADTAAWIAAQTWSSGEVMLSGGSADGIPIYSATQEAPATIRAIAPTVGTHALHGTTYQGGAYRLSLISWWLAGQGFQAVEDEVFAHEGFDAWWDPIELPGKESRCVFPGVHTGGQWDIFAAATLDAFDLLQNQATDPRCAGQQYLVFDPHGHCAGGDVVWPNSRTALGDEIAHYLFLRESGRDIPPALQTRIDSVEALTFYVLGPDNSTNGNFWTTLPTWPAVTPQTYYLAPGGRLDPTGPATPAESPPVSYDYNPNYVVRTVGGPELLWPCGPLDQPRTILAREDVFLFTTDAFVRPTAIVGQVTAVLWVSTDRNDTDFTVKLMDEYPGVPARTVLLQDGIVRLRWREGGVTPVMAVPGEVYRVEIDLWRNFYVFEPGHRLVAAISSSNYPRFMPNPNTGLSMAESQGGPILIARNTFYFDTEHPSHVVLPIVPLSSLPRNFTP